MKINDIIQEELKGVLSESYVMKDERFKFKQNVRNASYYNYASFTQEFDTDITESDLWVAWSVAFWLNENGIENLNIEIENVSGQFVLEMFNKQTDKEEQKLPKEISEYPWKFIIDQASLDKGGSLYISGMDFDFETNMCTVTF